ncbi:MAG TPA: transcriptional regulator GcvA [Gammaproteobacteria bacterium]|jgi:LysR family glycine cleavage system transcriptional activator
MVRRLPSLNALRAFEAGARHLSFTRAAEELSVTQTAISHQVRHLEDQLGVKLFERRTRELRLTPSGSMLYPAVAESLDGMAEAVARVRAVPVSRPLTVSVTPTFGARWLAQRLGRFWREHPDVDLRLHHSVQLVDLRRDDVDLAIRFGRGQWPGLDAEKLMRAQATPLCSPKLLSGENALRTPADLRHHVLIHEKDYQEWTEWLAAAGVNEIDSQRGPIIDDPNAIIRSTIEGDGVMIAIPEVLSPEIESGRLVAPFVSEPDPAFAYYLVSLPGAMSRPDVRAFRDFLMLEAGAAD